VTQLLVLATRQLHLADVRCGKREIPAASEAYCQAMLLQPQDPRVFMRIGGACADPDDIDRLFASCLSLLAESDIGATGWFNLGFAAQVRGSIDVAMQAYHRVLALEPAHVLARNNLGAALRDTGQVDAAAACFRSAAAAESGAVTCHSNLLYLMHFQPVMDPASLRKEHQRWNQRYASELTPSDRFYPNDRTPDRRLRIGYVSPNFYQHSVGRFLLQLFAHHDRGSLETFAYASVRREDEITARLRNSADHWIDARAMSDEALAEGVRADRIDILVDLTMHMRDQRLLCFARKPAPIQVTYLAYFSTTGLNAIDYRLTDPYLDPPGDRDAWYSELSVQSASGDETRICDIRQLEQLQQSVARGVVALGKVAGPDARLAPVAACTSRRASGTCSRLLRREGDLPAANRLRRHAPIVGVFRALPASGHRARQLSLCGRYNHLRRAVDGRSCHQPGWRSCLCTRRIEHPEQPRTAAAGDGFGRRISPAGDRAGG
jgi:tetratricopeptide (TPR) repeat protein